MKKVLTVLFIGILVLSLESCGSSRVKYVEVEVEVDESGNISQDEVSPALIDKIDESKTFLMEVINDLEEVLDELIVLMNYGNGHTFSYDEIMNYQNDWTDIMNELYQLGDKFNSQLPPYKYQASWNYIQTAIVSAADALMPCANLDLNGDGTITGSEASSQIEQGSSEMVSCINTAVDAITELYNNMSSDVGNEEQNYTIEFS